MTIITLTKRTVAAERPSSFPRRSPKSIAPRMSDMNISGAIWNVECM